MEVDGKSFPAAEGEELKLTGEFTNPTVRILVDPHREFSHGGLKFQYPRAYTFQANTKVAHFHSWTMSGNHFKIMYFQLAGDLTVEEYSDRMVKQFGSENCKLTPTTIELLGEKRAGIRLDVKVVHSDLTMDMYRFPSAGETQLLVFQDVPDESGKPSIEAQAALPVFQKSFVLK